MNRSYDIAGVLGTGGFGRVYEAIERDRRGPLRRVALKVLLEDPPAPEVLARLRDEVRLLQLIGDRAFVRAEAPRRIGGRWAVVLEQVDGLPLAALMTRPVPPRAALELVAECARALGAAARRHGPDGRPLGLVHRDLTPANLLVTRSGEVRIVDLGLGRASYARDAVTRAGVVAGTPIYVAPERFHGVEGPAGDVYSLGVALGRMCPPQAVEQTVSVVSAAPPPTAELLALAEGMRSQDPADRPPMREVERRASGIARVVGGPGLRDWAEGLVPERVPLSADDPWVGRRLDAEPDDVPVRSYAWVGWAAAAVIGVASFAWPRPAAPPVAPPPPPVEAVEPAGPPPSPEPVVALAPAEAPAPAPEHQAVPVWVRTRPWGHVVVAGKRWATEDRAMRLAPGKRVLELESNDGRFAHAWAVNVAADGENAFCWDFAREAPCSP